MKKQICDTCWNYSNALKRCMITQCTESPDTECEIGMHITKPEQTSEKDKIGGVKGEVV